MNEALALSKSIAELGILIIIAGAFIYMVYQNWKIKNEKDKQAYKKGKHTVD